MLPLSMSVRKLAILFVLAILTSALSAQEGEQVESGQVQIAGKSYAYRIRRLPLSAYPELPPSVRAVLEQRGCMVPQTWEARRPENAIHGAFYQSGHQDWAVLCSHEGESSLLVFRDGIGTPVTLMSYKDQDRLAPTLTPGQLGYAWAVDPAKPERLRQFSPGKRFEHEGIEDSLIEYTSVLHFCRDGMWMSMDGITR